MSKHGGFSGPNAGKYGPEKPSYLGTCHAVIYSSWAIKKCKVNTLNALTINIKGTRTMPMKFNGDFLTSFLLAPGICRSLIWLHTLNMYDGLHGLMSLQTETAWKHVGWNWIISASNSFDSRKILIYKLKSWSKSRENVHINCNLKCQNLPLFWYHPRVSDVFHWLIIIHLN